MYPIDEYLQDELYNVGGFETLNENGHIEDFMQKYALFPRYSNVLIHKNEFKCTEYFSIIVKDEKDNVVYKTTDSNSLIIYPLYSKEKAKKNAQQFPNERSRDETICYRNRIVKIRKIHRRI